MESVFTRLVSKHKCLLACLAIFSVNFPAYGAQVSLIPVDVSLYFLIGLSLPGLFLTIKPSSWQLSSRSYIAAMVISSIGFCYSVSLASGLQMPLALSFGALCLLMMYLWYFSKDFYGQNPEAAELAPHLRLVSIAISLASVVYLGQVWLVPGLDAYLGWLLYGGVVTFIAAAHVAFTARLLPEYVVRLVCQLILTAGFIGTMFFYLHAQASLLWLMFSFIGCIFIFHINLIGTELSNLQKQLTKKEDEESQHLTQEQLFFFTHDPATNLPSYQQAIVRFEQQLKGDSQSAYAIVVIKPKNFAYVNQVLGHQNSDIMLLQLAYCLNREVSNLSYLLNFDITDRSAKLARLPSLEFMLAIDLTKIDHDKQHIIEELSQRLMGAIPAAMSFRSFSLRFELVLGIATTLEHGQSIPEVISHAGDAAIEAEKRQLLWLEFNDEVARYTEQQLHRMERLKQDIANDNLKWQLAPQIDTTSKSVVGFSMQVRWQYNGEQLELAEFIDVAEQSGELYSLTKCMIVNAFKSLFELKKLGVFQPVGVRLNSTDLLEPDLGDFIEEQIQTYGISARYLMVQMSEPMVQMACERAKNLIDQLKALEVPICISDFDGSYESLRYIRKLSVDQLNISCQLLASEENAGAEKAIVNSLVSLARTMKLSFIGTQVNDISSLDAFKTMGGHVAEGNAIAPSISMSELEVWVANWYKQYPEAKGRG